MFGRSLKKNTQDPSSVYNVKGKGQGLKGTNTKSRSWIKFIKVSLLAGHTKAAWGRQNNNFQRIKDFIFLSYKTIGYLCNKLPGHTLSPALNNVPLGTSELVNPLKIQ